MVARYVFRGGEPHITSQPGGQGEENAALCFRPGQVYEFDGEPWFGPFELVPDEDGAETPPAPPAAPAAQSPAPAPASPAPAATPSPAPAPGPRPEGA